MRIDAITCCVGAEYAAMLEKSIVTWMNTLDSLVVVTKPGDTALHMVQYVANAYPNKVRVITTNIFTEYGAHFNKGAALCEAYRACDPTDWVLHFDADIIPPENWREKVEAASIRSGFLYGAPRIHENGKPADSDPVFHPYGYFQLWNVSDRYSWRWPIFDTWHPHCGSYDANFMDQWPQGRWKRLMFSVTHQGEPRTNWFGTEPEKQELMRPLLDRGLYRYRMDCNKGKDRLPVPKAKLRYHLVDNSPRWGVDVIRACMIGGPFLVDARTKSFAGARPIRRTQPFTQIQEEVLKCMSL